MFYCMIEHKDVAYFNAIFVVVLYKYIVNFIITHMSGNGLRGYRHVVSESSNQNKLIIKSVKRHWKVV